MVYADGHQAIEKARAGFVRKWKLRSQAVFASFDEAGDELFTSSTFPISQWKALRTTNALERTNEEFRRRTKTQASLPSEEAVLFLLFGLLRSGQVTLRRLVGWRDLDNTNSRAQAASRTNRITAQRRVLMLNAFPPIDIHHQLLRA
jgi:transposase-like protein